MGAAALAWCVVPTSPASALTRSQANAIALRALAPAPHDSVVVFGLARPLRRGSWVQDAGSGPSTIGRPRTVGRGLRAQTVARVRVMRVRRPAWLFWEDRAPYAGFAHLSVALLVDDRSGRVVAKRLFAWWPVVNGHRAAFTASPAAYRSRRYRIYDSTGLTVTAGSAAGSGGDAARAVAAGARRVASVSAGRVRNCLISIGTREDPDFAGSFAAVRDLARRLGLKPGRRFKEATDGVDLAAKVRDAISRQGCNQITLVLIGHASYPAIRGLDPVLHAVHLGGTPSPQLGLRFRSTRGGVREQRLDATAVKALILANRTRAIFNVVVESCWSGWTKDVLEQKPRPPNLGVVATSAGKYELSTQYVAGPSFFPQVQLGGVLGNPFPVRLPRIPSHALRNDVPNPRRASGFINAITDAVPRLLGQGMSFGRALVTGALSPENASALYGGSTPQADLNVSARIVAPTGRRAPRGCAPRNAWIQDNLPGYCRPPRGKVAVRVGLGFSVDQDSSGTVKISPAGITVSSKSPPPSFGNPAYGDVFFYAKPGATVTLTATHGANSFFEGWQARNGGTCDRFVSRKAGSPSGCSFTVTDPYDQRRWYVNAFAFFPTCDPPGNYPYGVRPGEQLDCPGITTTH